MISLPDSPTSVWSDTFGAYTPEPALQGDIKVDVAIIGAGFAGLMTAYALKRAQPSLRIALLEAKEVGYGASGRNGSFAMTVVSLGFGTTAMLHGKGFFKDAHTYMERAVDTLDAFIHEHELDCQRIRPGFLRVATTPGYIRRLQHDVELMQSLGFSGIEWLDAVQTRQMVNSPRYLGAMYEQRLLLVDPLRLVREEKRLVCSLGVQLYENTPALDVVYGKDIVIRTPSGSVTCQKVAYTTNGYSHLFMHLRRKQIPAFTYMIATEPLSEEQLADIGWEGQQGVEDARNLIHYYRITPDKRLVIGGGPVGLTYANSLKGDDNPSAWHHLERHVHFLFPHLKGIRITHRWGGPFSVTLKLLPAIGYLGDERSVYSLGCIGHGVSMSHLNADVLRDMILEQKTELLDCPFVIRKPISWPPEPLRMATALALRTYLQAEDWFYERHLPNH